MVAIDAKNITVEYRTPKFQTSTLKEYVVNALQGRNQFTTHKALDGVSVQVAKGESVALIGHNGSGKSTLLKVLAGIIQPPSAEIFVQGRIAPMIELGAGFDFELSGIENIYLSCTLMGLSRAEIENRMDTIVRFAELKDFIHMPFKNFSSGMQARLGFACATAVDPDVILADEVLSVGDSNFAKKCLHRIEELREKGASLILVSHDPAAVKRFCSRAYVFSRGKCVFNGTVDSALKINDSVMDSRLRETLTDAEVAEIQRKNSLSTDAALLASGLATDRPHLTVDAGFYQRSLKVSELKTGEPFSLRLAFQVEAPEHFLEDITVGFAIQTLSGSRVFGANNLSVSARIQKSFFSQNSKSPNFEFTFEKGISEIASGQYELIIGVHDSGLTRTILHEKVGIIAFNNDGDMSNYDNDIMQLNKSIKFLQLHL